MRVEKLLGEWYEINCYSICDEQNNCLLVDAGAKLEDIKNFVADKRVVGILLTHAHFDHALYLKEYIDFFAVPVLASSEAEKVLKDRSLNQAESWEIKEDLPITFLTGDGKIKIANFEIEYFMTPGHSPCCMCFKIGEILFAGDVLFNSGIGRLDLVGSSKQDMIKSLTKLEKLKFEKLYSGHGEESDYARQKRNIAVFLRFLKR